MDVTGYAIEQFDERILKVAQLPDTLPHEELLAVARVHFPGLADGYLEYVVRTVQATERNYVSDVEKIAALTRSNAQEAGRPRPTLDDIRSAIGDVLPQAGSSKAPGAGSDEPENPRGLRTPRKKALTPAQVFPALAPHASKDGPSLPVIVSADRRS